MTRTIHTTPIAEPMTAPCVCQGSGRIAGLTCALCRGSGDPSDIAPRSAQIETVDLVTRLLSAHQRAQVEIALHAMLDEIGEMTDPVERAKWAFLVVDGWLKLGNMGEARCAGIELYHDLDEATLARAGCVAEVEAKRRIRLHGLGVKVEDATYFEDDEDADRQVQWGQMTCVGGEQ